MKSRTNDCAVFKFTNDTYKTKFWGLQKGLLLSDKRALAVFTSCGPDILLIIKNVLNLV